MNNNDKNNERPSDIPEQSSTKPMDSKRDVAQSPDEKTDEDFPGYPHYPAKEDIMHQSTGAHRVDADLEEMASGRNNSGVSQRYKASQENEQSQTDSGNDNAGKELDGRTEEIGLPQNVSKEDMDRNHVPGSDIEEAAEKGSTNP